MRKNKYEFESLYMMNPTNSVSSTQNDKTASADTWFWGMLTLPILVFVSLLACFGIVMWCDYKYIGGLLGLSAKKDVLKFIGISMGGVLLVIQAIIANRRAKAMEKAADAQARANENTETGQRQERLKNAIEHLDSDSSSIRLGGTYELLHLAQDTPDKRQTYLDIFCSHIRRTTSDSKYQKEHTSKPAEEIQSLLTLLFVQEHAVFKGLQVNLQGSWLNGATLDGAQLQGAVLSDTYLKNAHLDGAQLQKADLSRAYLHWVELSGAQLQEASFSRARLQGAHLDGARLQGAFLFRAHLQGASLSAASLQGANLSRAQLQEANLGGARLQRADLSEAVLQGAYLEEAGLHWANLSGAQLQGAWLRAAQLHWSSLRGTKLQGVTSQIGSEPFKERMENRVGQDSDLSGVIFAGGLTQTDITLISEGWVVTDFPAKQESHVGQQISHEPPENSGAIIEPPYNQAEAERWIADYEAAMSEVPNEDDS